MKAKSFIRWGNVAIVFAIGFFGWYANQNLQTISAEDNLIGIANPAAVMCQELGYKYEIINASSDQTGICIMPDGQSCNAWEFYSGECGAKFNYCAQNGYDTITMTDGKDAFSPRYAACVNEKGVIGSISELMDLTKKLQPGCQSRITNTAPKQPSLLEVFKL